MLFAASFVYLLLVYLAAQLVWHGDDSLLTGSAAQPQEGLNYWRWYFIQDHITGILSGAAALAALGGAIVYEWVRHFRMKARRRALHAEEINAGN